MIRELVRMVNKWLEGKPVPMYLSGKGKNPSIVNPGEAKQGLDTPIYQRKAKTSVWGLKRRTEEIVILRRFLVEKEQEGHNNEEPPSPAGKQMDAQRLYRLVCMC